MSPGMPQLWPSFGGGMGAPSGDPFLGAPATGSGYTMRLNGPQPYRFGWTTRLDFGYLPSESTDAPLGDFGVFEFDSEIEYTTPLPDGWIFSSVPQFNYRSWDGPSGVGMPPNAYRFGWDLELSTPANAGWSVQLGFNPSLTSDFEQSLNSEAYNWDGRVVAFFHQSPSVTWAIGAAYWDRVDDIVIPYAGVVWTPNQLWEFRLIFPKPRVSVFIGKPWGIATWLYASGEYHVEVYQIGLDPSGLRERVQLEDWRLMLGLRNDNGFLSTFVEGGWVLGRDVEFANGTPGFGIGDGFIVRAGLRY